MIEIVLAFVVPFALLYYYGTCSYEYWKKRGVPYIAPKYPFLGNFLLERLGYQAPTEAQTLAYNAFPESRFFGSFSLRRPRLIIREPSLIEAMTTKEFSHFYDHYPSLDFSQEPLTAHVLFLEGEAWRILRNRLAPTFSSGKLKGMLDQLLECSDEFINCLSQLGNRSPIELGEFAGRFSIDVISSCAFGINSEAIKNPDSIIHKIGLRTLPATRWNCFRRFIRQEFSSLCSILRIKTPTQYAQPIIKKVIHQALAYREKNKIERPDFLHLMNQHRKKDMALVKEGKLTEDSPYFFSENQLLSNSFVFIVAGHKTTTLSISSTFYEFAINPEIQTKARHEVQSVIAKYDGQLTYDAIKEMTYLTQVIYEVLRLYPPVQSIGRIVTKDFVIPGTNVTLKKGMEVIFPIFAIHRDPKNHPEPLEFSPDRFTKENVEKIPKGAYIPFGNGPRICLGMKFAVLEMKVALAKVLLNFKILPCDKTQVPIEFDPRGFLLTPKDGTWVALEKIN